MTLDDLTVREFVMKYGKSDSKKLTFVKENLKKFLDSLTEKPVARGMFEHKACPHCHDSDRLEIQKVCPDGHVLCKACVKCIAFEDLVCSECLGDGFVDYARGDDSEILPCQICYPNCSWEDLRDDDDRRDE